MAGTLLIYHSPMRPIKTEYYKLHYKYYTQQEGGKKTFKTFKINIGFLITRRSHRNRREKVSSPSFLSWPPSIAHTLSHQITRYIVLDGIIILCCNIIILCDQHHTSGPSLIKTSLCAAYLYQQCVSKYITLKYTACYIIKIILNELCENACALNMEVQLFWKIMLIVIMLCAFVGKCN